MRLIRKVLADTNAIDKDIDRYMVKDHWLSGFDQMSELMPQRRIDMAALSRAVSIMLSWHSLRTLSSSWAAERLGPIV